ncbi:hypothetical protein PDESU_03272 [Pontiella desulfatans]|uniref:Uncharacterized protein n=1 Tax=Pontiella desulfatans TaxID=2750659 RepID=A0A6C2U5D0_PONDE|nr:PaaX family transcriptional regulator C-terminal domain-containing protein [Pontiella desulfatans]VGO14704.1 hypothetical protein PDESU_03272 [Pontiella desulfatans]
MELLELSALFLSRGGWALLNRSCYPSDKAFRSAKSRLLKQGLVAARSTGGEAPRLHLTETGQNVIPIYFHPEKRWGRSWNKIWYMLVYDVPEVDRKYRNVLRQFLKRKHLGQLQQSVWITPDDIRPDFDDLAQATNIDAFAYLFESRSVLGLPSRQIVEDSWNFEQLRQRQEHFRDVTQKNIALLQSDLHAPADISQLLRASLSAYHAAMIDDPLLPSALLPHDYAGKQAHEAHRALLLEIDKQAGCCS